MDEILRCYHSNETSTAVLSCGYYIFYDVALTFESVDEILWCYVPVMSNTVDMIRVEKYFSQLVRADKLSRLDIQKPLQQHFQMVLLIQMKASEQYFHIRFSILLHNL